MTSLVRCTLALGLLTLGASVQAQPFSVDWYKIAGGGGTSTAGVYAVSGTVGQQDAGGPMTGGNYSLTGGFWALVAVQTPGSPLLRIQVTTTNTVLLSWPSPSAGFRLQQNPDIQTSGWTDNLQTPSDDGTTKRVVINPPVGTWFFRLKYP